MPFSRRWTSPETHSRGKGHQLSRLLAIRNAAEYEERLMKEGEASEAVRDAERFLEWVDGFLE
ncbi:MAG: hypothetical protein Q8O47_04760 [Candidatus Bathyarchaeota archaeon]|nr:hypothetical protein [Candidatus Bathyarchaeota archaeon]